jgi:hypothetical protein
LLKKFPLLFTAFEEDLGPCITIDSLVNITKIKRATKFYITLKSFREKTVLLNSIYGGSAKLNVCKINLHCLETGNLNPHVMGLPDGLQLQGKSFAVC